MTIETYNDLKRYVGSKDDFTDDLLNMGFTKGIEKGRADAIKEIYKNIMDKINTDNRGNCDYFIVDQIENYLRQLKENLTS